MEDFSIARAEEKMQLSGLQSEWLESQKSGNSKMELAFSLVAKGDKQDGPGKDVADRLDKELADFAGSTSASDSQDMKDFKKLISKFCDEGDKKKAIEELGESYSKLHVQMGKNIGTTYDEMMAEGAMQPGRAGLEKDYDAKLDVFFGKLDKMPFEQQNKVYDLLEWQDGETMSSHRDRVREGLKDNKDLRGLLDSYNKMEDAFDKVQANKSPREKELEASLRKQQDDYHAMPPVVNKAYIRSEIKY